MKGKQCLFLLLIAMIANTHAAKPSIKLAEFKNTLIQHLRYAIYWCGLNAAKDIGFAERISRDITTTRYAASY